MVFKFTIKETPYLSAKVSETEYLSLVITNYNNLLKYLIGATQKTLQNLIIKIVWSCCKDHHHKNHRPSNAPFHSSVLRRRGRFSGGVQGEWRGCGSAVTENRTSRSGDRTESRTCRSPETLPRWEPPPVTRQPPPRGALLPPRSAHLRLLFTSAPKIASPSYAYTRTHTRFVPLKQPPLHTSYALSLFYINITRSCSTYILLRDRSSPFFTSGWFFMRTFAFLLLINKSFCHTQELLAHVFN